MSADRKLERPTGTVTFLFTDVEGSKRAWDAHPEQMDAALAQHDMIVREAILAHSGYVFATAGDSFSVAFRTAGDGVRAALAIQRDTSVVSGPMTTACRSVRGFGRVTRRRSGSQGQRSSTAPARHVERRCVDSRAGHTATRSESSGTRWRGCRRAYD